MKNDTPFNPLPLPENLKLEPDAGATKQERQSPGKDTATRQARSKTKRRSNRSKRHQSGASRMKKNCHVKRKELKGRINTRLQHLDKDKLKAVLLACGVAAGIVAAVIVAIKLMPLAALFLAILGLGAALRFWERLRFLPRPF
jgi:Flp pilus assembly protein TadB